MIMMKMMTMTGRMKDLEDNSRERSLQIQHHNQLKTPTTMMKKMKMMTGINPLHPLPLLEPRTIVIIQMTHPVGGS